LRNRDAWVNAPRTNPGVGEDSPNFLAYLGAQSKIVLPEGDSQPMRRLMSPMARRVFRIVLVTLLLAPAAEILQPNRAALAQSRPPEYVFGHLTALTGLDSSTDFGVTTRNAIMLAVDAVNAAGGVGGVPLRAIYADDRSSVEGAIAGARTLMEGDKVPIVFTNTPHGGPEMASAANADRVVLVDCCAGAATVGPGGPYVYSVGPAEPAAEMVLRYLRGQGVRRVAVIHNGTGFARHTVAVLQADLPKLGMQLAYVEECPQGVADFRGYLEEIKGSHPDVLSLTTFGEAIGPILDAARQVRMQIPIATSTSGLDPRYITSNRPPRGLLIGSPFVWEPATHPAQYAFVRAYQTRFGSVPDGVSALAYDAVRSLLPELIRYTQAHRLAYSGASLKMALDHVGTLKGDLTGDCVFTGGHRCPRSLAVLTVRDGQFKVLAVMRPRP
jgi:branched-chain amino acid transport system substrate-binding protein